MRARIALLEHALAGGEHADETTDTNLNNIHTSPVTIPPTAGTSTTSDPTPTVDELVSLRARRLEAVLARTRGELQAAEGRAATAEARVRVAEDEARRAHEEGSALKEELDLAQRAVVAGEAGVGEWTGTMGGTGSGGSGLGAATPSSVGTTDGAHDPHQHHLSVQQALMGQRDRLKRRTEQLESEVGSLSAQVKATQQRCDALQRDNLALAERARFLQEFGKQRGNGMMEPVGVAGVAARYDRQWDASVDAFHEFRTRIRAQKLGKGGVVDQTAHTLGMLFLHSRGVRTSVLGYLLALHVVLVLTVVRLGAGVLAILHHHHGSLHQQHLDELKQEGGFQ